MFPTFVSVLSQWGHSLARSTVSRSSPRLGFKGLQSACVLVGQRAKVMADYIFDATNCLLGACVLEFSVRVQSTVSGLKSPGIKSWEITEPRTTYMALAMCLNSLGFHCLRL